MENAIKVIKRIEPEEVLSLATKVPFVKTDREKISPKGANEVLSGRGSQAGN